MGQPLPNQNTEQSVSLDGSKATYSCVIADFTPAATATDMVTLVGAPGKIITVTRITIEGDATGSSTNDVYLYKRTALDTGGTATQPGIAKHDSSDPSPSGVVNQYSANPSGLGAGTLIRADHISVPATTGAIPIFPAVWEFGRGMAKGIKLLSGTESLAISWNGNAVPAGLSLYINIEWTEQ